MRLPDLEKRHQSDWPGEYLVVPWWRRIFGEPTKGNDCAVADDAGGSIYHSPAFMVLFTAAKKVGTVGPHLLTRPMSRREYSHEQSCAHCVLVRLYIIVTGEHRADGKVKNARETFCGKSWED